jgi:hypothetical protein
MTAQIEYNCIVIYINDSPTSDSRQLQQTATADSENKQRHSYSATAMQTATAHTDSYSPTDSPTAKRQKIGQGAKQSIAHP